MPKSRDHISPWQPTSEDDFRNQKDLESLETVPCTDGWTYNLTGLFTSAVTDVGNSEFKLISWLWKILSTEQFDWVCEDDWKGPFTQSVAFLGAVFGGFIFGAISDYYGRYREGWLIYLVVGRNFFFIF